jgi:hypothetical protein
VGKLELWCEIKYQMLFFLTGEGRVLRLVLLPFGIFWCLFVRLSVYSRRVLVELRAFLLFTTPLLLYITWACRGVDALTFASGVTDGADSTGRLLDIYILCSRFLFSKCAFTYFSLFSVRPVRSRLCDIVASAAKHTSTKGERPRQTNTNCICKKP